MRGLEDSLGGIRPEDLAVLGTDFGESFGVRGEVVVAVAYGVGCGAMARKDKAFQLGHSEGDEGRVEFVGALGGFVLC